MATISPPRRAAKLKGPEGDDGGRFGDGRSGGGGDGDAFRLPLPLRRYHTGIWFALVPIVMLFMALSSAYVVRQGLSDDWRSMAWPHLLWWNSAVLLASSATLEVARRKSQPWGMARHSQSGAKLQLFPVAPAVKKWLMTTLALGLLFLAGQLLAWKQLVAQGVYLATNPSSSFFYVLTATHAVHLLGGVVALAWVTAKCWKRLEPSGRTGVTVAGIYWHFMDAVWIYLLLLLVLWP
ncbi:MAG: cytochrome c oxidase subunit 3 [Acidobacteria bacterium]|nr:cytochrome c oxidase subunit 3 [Acidobacteriota bacterium]